MQKFGKLVFFIFLGILGSIYGRYLIKSYAAEREEHRETIAANEAMRLEIKKSREIASSEYNALLANMHSLPHKTDKMERFITIEFAKRDLAACISHPDFHCRLVQEAINSKSITLAPAELDTTAEGLEHLIGLAERRPTNKNQGKLKPIINP